MAFEHCLNVTAILNRCMVNMILKMGHLKTFPGTVHLVQAPELTKHFETLLHNRFD